MLIADLICAADNTRTMRAIVGPQVIENGSNAISPNFRFSLISSCSSVLCVFQCFLCQVLPFPPLLKNTQTSNIFTHFSLSREMFFSKTNFNSTRFPLSACYQLWLAKKSAPMIYWCFPFNLLYLLRSLLFSLANIFHHKKIVFSHVNIFGLSLQNPKQ